MTKTSDPSSNYCHSDVTRIVSLLEYSFHGAPHKQRITLTTTLSSDTLPLLHITSQRCGNISVRNLKSNNDWLLILVTLSLSSLWCTKQRQRTLCEQKGLVWSVDIKMKTNLPVARLEE